jgi:CheY-like chemotaxis protein
MTFKLLCVGQDTSFQSIKLSFENEDATTIRATSIALALFLARKNQPHLIICEPQLVDGKGLDLLEELSNEEELAQIPFAFLLHEKCQQTVILTSLEKKGQKKDVHFLILDKELVAPGELLRCKQDILQLVHHK